MNYSIRSKIFLNVLILVNFLNISKSEDTFDVTKYGADIRGINKSTSAISDAIDAAVKKGGGVVYFPTGEYLTGSIHLKSNIILRLEDKAIVKFSSDFDDYLPMVRIRWEGTELNNFSPLIYANGQQNIAIEGRGILDGQGKYWWDYHKMLVEEYHKNGSRESKYQKEFANVNNLTELKSELEEMTRIDIHFLRPQFIQLFDSKNILIKEVTIRNSPFWNINPVYCENVTITGVRIEAPYPSPNTDGIDPDSCKNVHISDSIIDVGDDCIAIKSGRDVQGRRIGRPTENVVINNCTMFRGMSGVAIGSEQSGGVRNVTVTNCTFKGTDRGFYIKSKRGRGGVVENIRYTNITMTDIRREAINIDLFIHTKLNSKSEPFSESTPVVHDIQFSHIRGNANHGSVELKGLEESPLENIKLSDVEIVAPNGLTANNTKNLELIKFSNQSVK
jgi:polygalacturonase